jgi:hypothetical protein
MPEFDDLLNLAIPLYAGRGITSFPNEDGSRLQGRFGPDAAPQLEARVKLLLEELDRFKPDWSKQSLSSASRLAAEEMKRNHPELDANAIATFEWVFSWWWK